MAIAILIGTETELRHGKGKLALTAVQAAARLEVSDRTFRRYVELARIAPHEERCGALLVFISEEVEALREELRRRRAERRDE